MEHVQRPNVSPQILVAALNLARPSGWKVSDVYITQYGQMFWNRESGSCGDENYPKSCRLVRLLTQLRAPVDGPKVDVDREVYDAGLKFAGISSTRHTDYPVKAQTGEQYLRWCAFEDHCLAAVSDADSPNNEIAAVKEEWAGLIPPGEATKHTKATLQDLNGDQHTLPVDAKIFEEALTLLRPYDILRQGRWTVKEESISCCGYYVWAPRLSYQVNAPAEMRDTVTHLLKSRPAPMPGWDELASEKRLSLSATEKRQYLWSTDATTGAEYVEACAWYDRVEAELDDEVDSRKDNDDGSSTFVHDSMHITFTREEMAEMEKPKPAGMKHQRPDVSCEILDDALRFALPGGWVVSDNEIERNGILFWSRGCGTWQGSNKKQVESARLVRLLTQDRFHSTGRLTGLTMSMHDDASLFAGRSAPGWPWRAETGEQYLRACAAFDHLIAQKMDYDSPNDEMAEVAAEWDGLIPGRVSDVREHGAIGDAVADDTAALTAMFAGADDALEFSIRQNNEQHRISVDDLRRAGALEDIPHAPEQPWERAKRIAASAGYAHVAEEETDVERCVRGQHEAIMDLIETGHGHKYTYAHRTPREQLTGMRIDSLGWATHGHAVTDAGNNGETGSDYQARRIGGPTLAVQDACQRFHDEVREIGDASFRTRRELAAALERRP